MVPRFSEAYQNDVQLRTTPDPQTSTHKSTPKFEQRLGGRSSRHVVVGTLRVPFKSRQMIPCRDQGWP